MHPEVEQDHPGDRPEFGMAIEPKTGTVGTEWEKHVELCDMIKRFWIGAALMMPVVLAGEHYGGRPSTWMFWRRRVLSTLISGSCWVCLGSREYLEGDSAMV